jgi:outer membrane PBP1 activator LpoA protein
MLALTALLLAGCFSTAPVKPTPYSPEHVSAIALLEQGQPREAAQRLEVQAALIASPERRSPMLADAAFAWHEAGDDTRARSLMAQVSPNTIRGATQARFALLTAELAIADGSAATALAALTSAGSPPDTLQQRWHRVRAQAFEANGNYFAAAEDLSRIDAALQGEARRDNRLAIERLLSALDDATLVNKTAALPAGDTLYNFAGRTLLRRGLPLPRQFDRSKQWRFDDAGRPPADRDGYRPPVQLAVLLPLSGNLAAAAAPVRDGLLTGYYGEARRRPEVLFYDTTGTAAGAVAAYAKATAAGADFVIGPLGRDEVTAIFNEMELPVPVLALNRGDAPPPPGNAGFALTPEDDGIAAAEYLLNRERRAVTIIGNGEDSSQRAMQSFQQRFIERGGHVTATIISSAPLATLSEQLITASAGSDSVFLAVRGPQARMLMPQLALAGFSGKSQVGTSQVTSGTGKADEDSILDGVVYPTETWTAHGIPNLPNANTLAGMLPTARAAAARLFAFGYDAWLITAYLERLVMSDNSDIRGATGVLRLDGFGNIIRTPSWATFRNGVPTPIYDDGG